MKRSHKIEWVSAGRKAKCAPNPNYPQGKDIDVHGDIEKCHVEIPYPAEECGYWIVSCNACDLRCAITAAGRSDDPRSYKMPCKVEHKKEGNEYVQ